MRSDFCAFILTHGRPDRVHTYNTLKRAGYTGKIYIVIDDEDKTADEYRKRFGDMVIQFCKADIAKTFDEADNFNDRRAIVYARNVCWQLAEQVGCKYFIQLDDDYHNFNLRFDSKGKEITSCTIRKYINEVMSCMLDFAINCQAQSVAMAQGGDAIGGPKMTLRRKCMNSFICSTDKPFIFSGRVNEDVNTYTTEGRRGVLFFTVGHAQLVQTNTQKNAGGMADMYLDSGTYIKSFYSVMMSPSCVKIGMMGDGCRWKNPHYRIHHKINWHNTAPKILSEDCKKK